jgi:hypothetical protein
MSFLDQLCESISSCFPETGKCFSPETGDLSSALVYIPSRDILKEDRITSIARKYNYLYEDPEMEIWFRRQTRDW